jgi:predicted Zn-dependent protease
VRSCTPPRDYSQQTCLAIAYDKLGRHAEADAAIAAMMRAYGESAAYQFAEIYAQRADTPNALAWLETADRIGDTGLHYMAEDDLVDPLRKEPRFKKVLAKLNLP